MPARRRSATARVPSVPAGLRLHAEGERYSTLLKERDRLLRNISTKKKGLERVLAESREAHAAVLGQLQPLLEQFEALTTQLRTLFEQLLAPGRLSESAAKQVAKVRQTMAGLGYLGQLDDDEPSDVDESEFSGDHEARAHSSRDERWSGEPDSAKEAHAKREVGSAPQRGQGKDQESLRAVFRRLVAASHPDRASNEAERELRTATMKQATQAYEAGDLARLLELEKAWHRGQSLPPADSAEASCRELERVIRELRAQATQLQRELREAKANGALNPLDETMTKAVEEAHSDLEQLETLRNFVTRYRDGKMSLKEFVRGPQVAYVDEDEAMEAMFAELLGVRASKPSKATKGPRAKPKRGRSKG